MPNSDPKGKILREPYRIFFPMGFLFAALGLGSWILFYFRPGAFPHLGEGHAALQIQGFLLCFNLGFLCTLLPKAADAKPIGPAQLGLFIIGIPALIYCALAHHPLAGQVIHLLLIMNALIFALPRLSMAVASAVPSVFIFQAVVADLLGTSLAIASLLGVADAGGRRAGALLQFQAFPLLMLIGVGSIALPKIFTYPSGRSPIRTRPWTPWLLGLAFLGGYAVEAWGGAFGVETSAIRLAYVTRAATWFWFLFTQVRMNKVTRKLPSNLKAVRVAVYAMGMGMIMPILVPIHLLAWEHVIFISGFLWLSITLASRVIASGSRGRISPDATGRVQTLFRALKFLAVFSRVASDMWTTRYWMMLALAAAFALLALMIWAAHQAMSFCPARCNYD